MLKNKKMTPINLYQEGGSRDELSKKTQLFGTSFFLGLLLMALTLATWGILAYLQNSYIAKNILLDAAIAKYKSELGKSDQVNQIADIQARIKNITDNLELQGKSSVKTVLQDVAAGVVDGVTVISYSEKEGAISLTLISGDYANIAKQIAKFKSIESFFNVAASNLARGEKGISFEISMMRKKQ